MKTKSAQIKPYQSNKSFGIRSVLTLALLLIFMTAGAQSSVPSVRLSGNPMCAVNGPHLFITAEITGGDSITVTFSLERNYSGATIVSQGTYTYDSKTGMRKQTVEINPGNTKGSFIVKAEAINSTGKGEASMTAITK